MVVHEAWAKRKKIRRQTCCVFRAHLLFPVKRWVTPDYDRGARRFGNQFDAWTLVCNVPPQPPAPSCVCVWRIDLKGLKSKCVNYMWTLIGLIGATVLSRWRKWLLLPFSKLLFTLGKQRLLSWQLTRAAMMTSMTTTTTTMRPAQAVCASSCCSWMYKNEHVDAGIFGRVTCSQKCLENVSCLQVFC